MEVFILKHHVIAILAPGCILPCTTQFDLLTGRGIFQLVALGFHQQYLSTVCHYDKVRVVVAESIQAERIPSAGGIAVSPADTINTGQRHCHVVLEIIVQLTFLLVQALGQGGSLAGQGDKRCQLEPGFGDDLAYLKPVIYIWYTL